MCSFCTQSQSNAESGPSWPHPCQTVPAYFTPFWQQRSPFCKKHRPYEFKKLQMQRATEFTSPAEPSTKLAAATVKAKVKSRASQIQHCDWMTKTLRGWPDATSTYPLCLKQTWTPISRSEVLTTRAARKNKEPRGGQKNKEPKVIPREWSLKRLPAVLLVLSAKIFR